jgi:hypothetical protein
MENVTNLYKAQTIKTANDLKSIAQALSIGQLSHLTLPQIEAAAEGIARLVPAGNIPGLILSGLARLPGRRLPPQTVRRDINILFKGVEQTLDAAVYSTFFAGPAAVIWGYQNLLKLAGKEVDQAFPEGLWQFYVDYAMREDTARHANETYGFDRGLAERGLRLRQVDRLTAWVMAAIEVLHSYPDLLANEWRERVQTHLLAEVMANAANAAFYAGLYPQWEKQRPYGLGPDAAAAEAYPAYRQGKFDQFLAKARQELSAELQNRWAERVRQATASDLPAYQQQMSMLVYLDPGPYGETRTPIPLSSAHIGLIQRGRYYLLPVCEAETGAPATLTASRARLAAILAEGRDGPAPTGLTALARCKRATWPTWRPNLSQPLLAALDQLRTAPILLNSDRQPPDLALAELRQAERGVGDHALTLFDTGQSFVFDQSHILFDGAWGAALAEIMTQSALRWAEVLARLPAPAGAVAGPSGRLNFEVQPRDLTLIKAIPQVTPEIGVETAAINLKMMLKLRRMLKQRNERIELTVNDLLLLYRAIHAVTYRPQPELLAAAQDLCQNEATRRAASSALAALDNSKPVNPALVIPVDASRRSPGERLHPITFEVPLAELGLPGRHEQVVAALAAYQQAADNRARRYAEFEGLQRSYLATLAHLGELLSRIKAIAAAGEGASMSAIKLVAHLPTPLQRLLDRVPDRFDLLNDLIKGREAFSNVGAVVPASTLTRFISAKDDNEKKTLVWGVITDAEGVMRLSLRDFRPHIGLLSAAGQANLARRMSQHYLDSYAHGLNRFVLDLIRITQAKHEALI